MSVATNPTFGTRLKLLREQAGLSQNELAKRASVTGQAISLIESGRREPNWSTVIAIARVLNVNVSTFDVEYAPLAPMTSEQAASPAVMPSDQPPRAAGKRK